MAAEQCSVCGAGLDADGSPTCDCTPRTAEEAVAAAFDSFRPLRVRPYFAPNQDDEETVAPPPPPRESLIRDPAVPRSGELSPALTHGAPGHAGWTGGPKAEDVDLFEGPGPEPEAADEGGSGNTLPVPVAREDAPSTAVVLHGGPRRPVKRGRAKRKGAAIAAAAAVLTAGVIAFTTAMGGGSEDDRADPLPTDAGPTASAPDDPDQATESPSSSASASPSKSAGSSASPSSSASADKEEKDKEKGRSSRTSAPPKRADGGISVPASPSDTGGAAAGGGGGAEEPDQPEEPPTLKEGDSGAEVVELQKRLKQVFTFYWGAEDGEYDSEVTTWVKRYQEENKIKDDPDGVYDPATRKALEAETDEP